MAQTNPVSETRREMGPVSAGSRDEVVTLRPYTDIKENKDGVTLYFDMPGVGRDDLAIDVDKNVLTVRGSVNLGTDEALKPAYVEVKTGVFERRFTLGEELDIEHIDASLKQGVLKLHIPRSEQHKPRKIEIKVA